MQTHKISLCSTVYHKVSSWKQKNITMGPYLLALFEVKSIIFENLLGLPYYFTAFKKLASLRDILRGLCSVNDYAAISTGEA